MAKDPDNLAADFDTESATGLIAEEHESGRSMLWRLGSWGVAAVGAVVVAVMANQSSLMLKRDQVAAVDVARQAQQLQTLSKESHNETRRLASAIDTLNSDRDRLYSRVSTLEQGLDSVTGAIAKQPPLVPPMPAPAATALVAPTAPPAPAPAQAAAPAVAPVATTEPTPSDKQAASDKPPASDKVAAPAERPTAATEKPAAAVDKKSAAAIKPQAASETKPQAVSDTRPQVADKPQASSDKPATSARDNSQAVLQAAAAPTPAVAASPAAAAAAGPAAAEDGKPSAPTPPVMLTADNSMIGPPVPAAGKPLEPIKPPTAHDVKATPMPEVATAAPAEDAEADEAGAPKAQIQRTEFGVDLGTANSVNGLRALWRGLLRVKANAPLAALHPIIVIKENTNGLGMQLRLVAGPLNDAGTAAKICAGLSLTRRTCETAIYDGQRLTLKPDDELSAGKPVHPQRRFAPKRAAAPPPVAEEKKPEPATFSSIFRRNGQ